MGGMRLLRYFNFCARGFAPESQSGTRDWIVSKTVELFACDRTQQQALVTCATFVKRKLFRGKSVHDAVQKERAFRAAVIAEFTMAATFTSDAAEWYKRCIEAVYL